MCMCLSIYVHVFVLGGLVVSACLFPIYASISLAFPDRFSFFVIG